MIEYLTEILEDGVLLWAHLSALLYSSWHYIPHPVDIYLKVTYWSNNPDR